MAGLFLGLICAGIVLAGILQDQQQAAAKAKFSRIERGMSDKQAEEILSSIGFVIDARLSKTPEESWSRRDGAKVMIVYSYHFDDHHGGIIWEVADKKWVDSTETIYQTVRRWLRVR